MGKEGTSKLEDLIRNSIAEEKKTKSSNLYTELKEYIKHNFSSDEYVDIRLVAKRFKQDYEGTIDLSDIDLDYYSSLALSELYNEHYMCVYGYNGPSSIYRVYSPEERQKILAEEAQEEAEWAEWGGKPDEDIPEEELDGYDFDEGEEDKISKLLKDVIGNRKEFRMSNFVYEDGEYYIVQIWDFVVNKKGTDYGDSLECLATAGVLEKVTEVPDASIANYIKKKQLSNGETAMMRIAYRGNGPCDIYTEYLGEGKRLLEKPNYAEILAHEMIIPELDTITRIVNKGKNKETQEQSNRA